MELQRTKIGNIVAVGLTATTLVQNGADQKTFARGILVHNTAAVPVTVAIHWLLPAATPEIGNRIFNVALLSSETQVLEFPYSIVMTGNGEAIVALGTAAGCNAFAMGDRE